MTALPGGAVRVHVADLAPWLDRHAEFALALSPGERARADRLVFEADRRRFRVAHGLLRRILGGILGAEPAAVGLRERPGGKPELAPPHDASGLRFNLSHSGDVLLVAVARGREVGVDVERIREDLDWAALARRFLPEAAGAPLFGLPAASRRQAFFRFWTFAEALGKAAGIGLSIHDERHRGTLEDLARRVGGVLPARPDGSGGTPPLEFAWDRRDWRLFPFEARPGMPAAVAAEAPVAAAEPLELGEDGGFRPMASLAAGD